MPLSVPMPGDQFGNAAAPFDPTQPPGGMSMMGGIPYDPNQMSPAAIQALQNIQLQLQQAEMQKAAAQSGQQAALQASLAQTGQSGKNIQSLFPGGVGQSLEGIFSGLFGPQGVGGLESQLADQIGGGAAGGAGGVSGFKATNGPQSATIGAQPGNGTGSGSGSYASSSAGTPLPALSPQAQAVQGGLPPGQQPMYGRLAAMMDGMGIKPRPQQPNGQPNGGVLSVAGAAPSVT